MKMKIKSTRNSLYFLLTYIYKLYKISSPSLHAISTRKRRGIKYQILTVVLVSAEIIRGINIMKS